LAKKVEEHSRELERLEQTKADARAVWAEFRNRPDIEDLRRELENQLPAVQNRVISAAKNALAEELAANHARVDGLTNQAAEISEKLLYMVSQHELEVKMEEWATLVRATVRADDQCSFCGRPILARVPGEKTCMCSMREK
jgi:hypothetical protein